MSLRVLHVDTARSWRGGQNQVLLTAAGMAARGHEVTIACRGGGELETRARAAGLRVRPVPFRGDLWPPGVAALGALLRATRPQVLQLHDPHAVSAALIARRLAGHVPAAATRRVDFALRGRLSRAKYRGCERVVAVSRAILGVLGAAIGPERLRLVYEGVADRRPAPGGEDALRALGVPPSAPVVGNVAALTGHKDHVTLLQAAALVVKRRPDARFLVLGEGEEKERLLETRRALGLEAHVLFPGFRRDLDALLPAFTIFCLSSKMEGLGTSLLDAMAFGRPVVATAAGGIPEAVEDAVTGRVVPVGAPEALAGALLDLLEDDARRQAMGAAGRRRFEALFTADRMVESTLGVLSEIAS
jgi:glycosyltransferase involved in cell wall biosynthesis